MDVFQYLRSFITKCIDSPSMPTTRAKLDKSAVKELREKKKLEEDEFEIVKYEVK